VNELRGMNLEKDRGGMPDECPDHHFRGMDHCPHCGEPLHPDCRTCGHSYAQHTKGPVAAMYCRHCPCHQYVGPTPESEAAKETSGETK
jgi:hypothetical protein